MQAACKDMGWSHGTLSRPVPTDGGGGADAPGSLGPLAMVASCGPQDLSEQGQGQGVGNSGGVELDTMSGACVLGDVDDYNRQARGDSGGGGDGGGDLCSTDHLVHLLCVNVE